MNLLEFAIVMLSGFHGTKLIFLGVKLGLLGYNLVMLNLVIIGAILIVFPVYILQWIKEW